MTNICWIMPRISKNWKPARSGHHQETDGPRVYDAVRRLCFRQRVGWSASSRRGAIYYFRDLSFGGFPRRAPGAPPFSLRNQHHTPRLPITENSLAATIEISCSFKSALDQTSQSKLGESGPSIRSTSLSARSDPKCHIEKIAVVNPNES